MAFAQLTYRESLRDIEACLRATDQALPPRHSRPVSRNTLANANSVRDWRIYADFAQVLITQRPRALRRRQLRRRTRPRPFMRSMPRPSICACRFSPGPSFASTKGGQAAHASRPARQYPDCCHYYSRQGSRGQHSRSTQLRSRCFLCDGSGYLDFARLYRLHLALAFFVTRAKTSASIAGASTHNRSTKRPA